jgi:DNA (cytosine-5)-methyltransferase 1
MVGALDLFCGAGGATKGLQRAGFHVTGVDIKRQPHYIGDSFVQADALEPPLDLRSFDFIWASPPCQAYSVSTVGLRNGGKTFPDLVARVRSMLKASGIPFAIENVPRAPLIHPIKLRGPMFPELRVIRERWFETSWFQMQPCQVSEPRSLMRNHGYVCVVGHGIQTWARERGLSWSQSDVRLAMGIDWMTRDELSQAVPPVYSEFIARAFLAQLPRGG